MFRIVVTSLVKMTKRTSRGECGRQRDVDTRKVGSNLMWNGTTRWNRNDLLHNGDGVELSHDVYVRSMGYLVSMAGWALCAIHEHVRGAAPSKQRRLPTPSHPKLASSPYYA